MIYHISTSYKLSMKQFDHFELWCKEYAINPFFASPEVFAEYLSYCAERHIYSPATIRDWLAPIYGERGDSAAGCGQHRYGCSHAWN